MTFAGFDRAAVALLADFPKFDASTFAEHRVAITTGLVEAGTSLIHEVAERLGAGLTVVPRSSVSPLHTDLRFAAPGAARYKDHLLLTTWHGVDKKMAPTLWIRIDATSVGFASGIPFTPEIRDRWRRAIAGPRGAALARSIRCAAEGPCEAQRRSCGRAAQERAVALGRRVIRARTSSAERLSRSGSANEGLLAS